MAELSLGSVRAKIDKTGDGYLIHSLESDGDAGELRAFFRQVREKAGIAKIFLCVDSDNPKKEKLMRMYETLGAKQVSIVLEVI